MKFKLFFLIVACLFGMKAHCALPPWAQNAKEIQTLKNHPEYLSLVQDDPGSVTIQKVDDGYLIETEHYVMKVHVNYLPSKKIGPAEFAFNFELPEAK